MACCTCDALPFGYALEMVSSAMDGLGPLPPVGAPDVTLVEGACFTISGASGDMTGDVTDAAGDTSGVHGLFYRDTRYVSVLRVSLDGRRPESLSVQPGAPYETTFLSRRAGSAGAQLLFTRHRQVGAGLREELLLRNLGLENTICRLTLEFDTDFADMFSVKEGHPRPVGDVTWSVVPAASPGDSLGDSPPGLLAAEASNGDRQRGVRISLDIPSGQGGRDVDVMAPARTLAVSALVPARGGWRATVRVQPIADHEPVRPVTRHAGSLAGTGPDRRLRARLYLRPDLAARPDSRSSSARPHRTGPSVLGRPAGELDAVLDRSLHDLGSLRIPMTDESGAPADAVAAGAPWFMTLFGRDSLLTSLMVLPLHPGLALSTLRVLAARQGTTEDPLNEEQPGRILHEVRHGDFPLSPGRSVYYGTIDATPLFCMLAGELLRHGLPTEQLRPLMQHVDRALEWMLRHGDRDGDGFLEYLRSTDRGLYHQCWKDSGDSMVFGDGRQAEPPIAPAEVQGYAYAAFLARAELARAFGDDADAGDWEERAKRLRHRFHEAFWLPDEGYYAMALDGDKRPLDVLASNMGHCLWTGIVDPSVAGQVAERLVSPELFSGWGIRTLASSARAYDPASYHRGSVWPHDTALCAAGLARYGFVAEARRVAAGVFEAATAFAGRLPELFCGFPRTEFPYPVPYPTSCSPQAWAAAAPIMLVRALLDAPQPNATSTHPPPPG